jgi:hypothetical protein
VLLLKDKHFFNKHPVREGDDTFFVGLFTPFYGSTENIPIFRFGRVALVSDEKIPFLDTTGTNTPQDLFMVESQVFGGNSGSPAFFYTSKWHHFFHVGDRPFDLHDYVYLAGVVKGHFNDWTEVKSANSDSKPFTMNNVGVAVVVPAYHLYDMIFSEEEKKFRTDFEQLWWKTARQK